MPLPTPLPRPTTLAERDHVKTLAVTGKVRAAVEAMVWQGLARRDAAAAAGLTEHSLYTALRKPHVRSYYLSLLDVLRTSERARNIHTLVDVREQKTNQMARVAAVKALEQIEEQQLTSVQRSAVPGLVIVIGDTAHTRSERVIDAKPLIDQASGHIDGVGTEPDDSQ